MASIVYMHERTSFSGTEIMERLNLNRVVVLIAVIAMMLIAANSGYRLQLSVSGLTFEGAALR